MESVLHGLLTRPATMASRSWAPPVDVYRVTDGWLLKFELAGVAREDFSIAREGSRIVVRGVRLDRCLETGCSVLRMEIAYNVFERGVDLMEDLSGVSLSSEYSNGMLLLRVTRKPNA